MSEVDLNKIMAWDGFKSRFISYIEENDPFEVDLSFEYKDKMGHTVSYSSGQTIYINDIKFSALGQVLFEVPYGGESRFIPLSYADNISNASTGLDLLVDKCYEEFYNTLEDKTGIEPTFDKFYLSIGKSGNLNKLSNVLNNATEYLQKIREAEADEKSFGGLDEFGLF